MNFPNISERKQPFGTVACAWHRQVFAPKKYNPNFLLIKSDWFGFTYYLENLRQYKGHSILINANINLFSVVLQKYLDFISPLKYPCAGGWDDYTIKVTIKKGESNLVNKDGDDKTLTVNFNNGNIDIDFMK